MRCGVFFRSRRIAIARELSFHERQIIALLVLLLALIGLASIIGAIFPASRLPVASNTLKNPPGMVDRLVMFDTAEGFAAGTHLRTQLQSGSVPGVRLVDGAAKSFPRNGVWTSPELMSEFPFTELLPSWNVQTPPETGIAVEVRVRDRRRQEWSPWLYCGSWGRIAPATQRTISFRRGIVNVDNLVLDRPADAIQARVTFQSFTLDPASSPLLRRLSFCYSGIVRSEAEREKLAPHAALSATWARDLPVPFRTQKDAPPAISPEICSPTSVSMVMSFW